MTGAPRSVWSLGAELGEGPIWHDEALWFVDIKRQQIHRYEPGSGLRRSWPAPEQIGFIFPRQSGGFIAGLQSGLFAFDPTDGSFSPVAEVERDRPGNRLNDGVVDPAGRLWFGSMDNAERASCGAFYCYDDGKVSPVGVGEICITNGPAISPDGSTIYLVDTLARSIFVASIEEHGSLGKPRLFKTIESGAGYPDGPTIDSEGHLWIGLYDGWEARRYSPSGDLVDRVRFPVANITKIAFGGPDLRTAYATTARQMLSPEAIASQPQIGDLFEFEVDVPGLPCHLIAG